MADVAEPVLAGDSRLRTAEGDGERRRELADGARGAAADVVRAQGARPAGDGGAADRLNRGDGGARPVADVAEVPQLLSVLETPRRAAGLQAGAEERRPPGVRRVARHPRAV